MAACLSCLVLVLVSTPLYQRSEAVPTEDENRALIAYILEVDKCKGITDSSRRESKGAADGVCVQAFKALDNLRLNTCHGWRNAECRLLPGQKTQQCSCLVSYCDDTGIRNDVPRPFRMCVKKHSAAEAQTKVMMAPTVDRQKRKRKFDEALAGAQTQHASRFSDPFSGAESSTGAHFTFRAGTSSAAQTSGTEASKGRPKGQAEGEVRKPFPCSVCPRSYMNRRSLTEHMKCHETDDTKCPVCSMLLSKKGNLKAHLLNVHPGTPLPLKAIGGRQPLFREHEPGAFACGTCGNTYSTRSGMLDHAKCHTTLETHCFQCKVTLGSKSSYRVHLRRWHPEDALAEEAAENKLHEEEKPVKCGECNKRFKSLDGLRHHKKFHDGRTTCKECGLVLPRLSSLSQHKKRAHSKKKDNN